MKRSFTVPNFAVNLINLAYERVFHEKMNDAIRSFLKNLSYVAIGTFISILLSSAFNILSGRILGPNEYGKFTIVQSVAMFLHIPMLLGFNTAIVKYASEKEDIERQSRIISTAYILISIFTIASAIIYSIFSPQLSSLFSVSNESFYLSIVFAVPSVFYTLTTSTLRGLFKMKTFAVFQPIYAVIVLFVFLFFILNNFLSFKSMVYSMSLAYGIISAILPACFLRKYLRFEFDKSWANTLTKYSVFSVIGGVAFVFYTNIDRIIINKRMTIADLGIYKVYSIASINIIGLLYGAFNIVFFPTVSKYRNKLTIFKKINKSMPFLIGFGISFVLLCELLILKLYGNQYPFVSLWVILFAVASICMFVDSIYGWLLSSLGRKGVKLTSFAAIILASVNAGLNIIFVPLIGITGAIVSTIVSFIVSIAIMLCFGREYIGRQSDEESC